MKDKIIVWLDSNLMQYCACYYLQREIDADFYAIVDVTNKTRHFFLIDESFYKKVVTIRPSTIYTYDFKNKI